MKKNEERESRFPLSVFAIYLGILLLMAGVHTGLIVMMNALGWSTVVQILVPFFYWSLTAAWLTFYTRQKMRKVYDEPLQRLAEATQQVARGDFSVYMPTIHSSDEQDYLDEMILDFNRMVAELGSIETLKTDFVSNVSHEMKTPIAVIKNSAELLKNGRLPEGEEREYAQTIIDASMRLSNLITDILKLNKLENQAIVPNVAEYDLSLQLADCILQFETVWEQKEINLEIGMEDSVMISADESLMELVWNNLLSNAVKFTERGGKIVVHETSGGNSVTVTVSDTGCGMSEETQKHIFDKFYQGDTSHAIEGNGLGLALTTRIIKLMGGEITVDSRLGEGSVFTVRLPGRSGAIDHKGLRQQTKI